MPEDTPAPARPPQSFRLPLAAWLAWGICAGLLALHTLSYLKDPSPFQTGEMAGQAIGLLILPTLVAVIAWRAAGRSARATLIGFMATLALVTLAQVPQALEKARKHAAVDKMNAVARESRDELLAAVDKGGGITPEMRARVLDKTKATLSEQAASSSGEDREIALAMQAFMARATACQQRQVTAVQAIGLNSFHDLDGLASAAQRTARREAIQNLQAANAGLREFVLDGASWAEAELNRRHVSPNKVRSVLAGYASSSSKTRAPLLGIRDTEDQLAQLMLDFVSFAETYDGQWSKNPESGKLVLPTDAAVEQYNALLARLTGLGQRQAALQKELLAAAGSGN